MKLIDNLSLFAFLLFPLSLAAAQPYTTEFSKGEIVVESLKRTTDETVLIKGVIKNTSSESYSWYGSDLLANYSVIDVRLQDLKTKRQFEQVMIGDKCVGSNYKGSLGTGKEVKFWARVTAPPAETKEVSIIFAGSTLPIESAIISD
jgi:hypothetical protein